MGDHGIVRVSVTGHVHTPEGISDIVHSTIGVKHGCPLSPTLFGMYIDEVSDYIDREGDRGAQLARVTRWNAKAVRYNT